MPERTVYTLTPAGEEGLRRLVAEGLASQDPVRFDYNVPLAYLDVLPLPEVLGHLQKRRDLVTQLRRQLEEDWEALGAKVGPGYRALIWHDLDFYRTEERWLGWLIEDLAQNEGMGSHGRGTAQREINENYVKEVGGMEIGVQRKPTRVRLVKAGAVFSILVGVSILGMWVVLLSTGQVSETKTGPTAISFHLVSEFLTTVTLIIGGLGTLTHREWGSARTCFRWGCCSTPP